MNPYRNMSRKIAKARKGLNEVNNSLEQAKTSLKKVSTGIEELSVGQKKQPGKSNSLVMHQPYATEYKSNKKGEWL